MKKDQIIFVSKFIPVNSATGAMQRNTEWLKFLQKRYDIILFGIEKKADAIDKKNMKILDNCIEVISSPITNLDLIRAGISRLFINQPLWVGKYHSKTLNKKLKKTVSKAKISFIFCSELSTFQYTRGLKGDTPIYLDDHNVEFALTDRLIKISKGFKKILYLLDLRPLKSYEKEAVRGSRHVFTVSDHDKKILINSTGESKSKFTTVNNSFSYKGGVKTPSLSVAPSIVFVGNLNWLPNKQGLIHFLRYIWPTIFKKIPKAELTIIGSGSIKGYEEFVNINNTNFYPNASEKTKNTLIDKGWVCVVPLYAGGGTRIKIIEYWAHKKAVVSTSVGAEGLVLSPGTIIKDSDKEFSESIIKIISNGSSYCQRIGLENYNHYQDKYVSERIYEDSLYNTLSAQ